MKIVKSNGAVVNFDQDKIKKTLERAGASQELTDKVLSRVVPQVYEGMATKKLFNLIRKELRKEERYLAQRYGLRTALTKLGPAGFNFEKYVASILNAYKYNAIVPENDYVGLCVNHEVDVVATKNDHSIVIEAKFRNKFGDTVKLKDVMATWSRYTDLCDGATKKKCPHFDEMWIVTNGKFTDRALQFGLCKGIILVGWSNGDSLARLVDHASLYPITVIDGLKSWELDRFAERGIMLCKEVIEQAPEKLAGRVKLPLPRTKKIWQQCKKVVEG